MEARHARMQAEIPLGRMARPDLFGTVRKFLSTQLTNSAVWNVSQLARPRLVFWSTQSV